VHFDERGKTREEKGRGRGINGKRGINGQTTTMIEIEAKKRREKSAMKIHK